MLSQKQLEEEVVSHGQECRLYDLIALLVEVTVLIEADFEPLFGPRLRSSIRFR
jgi:hypothetical protein